MILTVSGRRGLRGTGVVLLILTVLVTGALAVATNVATSEPLPGWLRWLNSPPAAWSTVGLLLTAATVLAVVAYLRDGRRSEPEAPNQERDGATPDEPEHPVFVVPAAQSGDVPRPDLAARLLTSLSDAAGGYVAITTALAGAGGFGKTTLARMLVHTPEVRQLFPGGILWLILGEDVAGPDLAERINNLCAALSGSKPPFTDPLLAGAELGRLLGDGRFLLVLDDVWFAAQLEPFSDAGRRTVRLLTTRRRTVVPDDVTAVVDVDAMQAVEARQVLTDGLDGVPESALTYLLGASGRWPVLLSLINGAARADVRAGASPEQALNNVADELRADGVTALDATDPHSRSDAVSSTVTVSLERLTPAE